MLINTYLALLLTTSLECYEQEQIETKECRERERLVTSDKDDLYALVDAIERQRLILRCRFCNEAHDGRPKNWYKIPQLGISEPYEVQADTYNDVAMNRIKINYKNSLIFENFTREDVGFYYCVNFEDQTNREKFNYLVDIVFQDEIAAMEKGNITAWAKYQTDYLKPINKLLQSSKSPEIVKIRGLFKLHLELITQWSTWSMCQVCGRPQGQGIRRKTGKCKIKITPSTNAINLTLPDDIYLFNAPAISCRSQRLHHLFPGFSNLTRIIPDFVLQERCDGICSPDAEGIGKGWKVGKGKGYKYRKTSVLQENSHLTFVCPESTLDNRVVWKKNGKVLKKGDNSYPHVMVDTFSTLYLIEVTRSDAGNYTCEVDDIRMQQIVVFVHSKTKLLTGELVRYMVYLGFILFLSSFCYCAGLVVTCQRRHTFKSYRDLKEQEPDHKKQEYESLIK
ncbi:uncharacterized protein LOC132696357 [Cylas formicarius]|uniref:uncharacterized protein LOC132696357 n=1 Tax=Cylas formicarius TaxID=197179 RepID=UPI0029587A8B|nr:uncharacterized protein LOC132696357 [Cylas formicarius]